MKQTSKTKYKTTSLLLTTEYLFVLAKLLLGLGLGLPSNVADIPSSPPLQTTDFPSPSRYQLQTAKFLAKVEFCSYPLLSVGSFVWFDSVQTLCILSLSLWVPMWISSAVLGRRCFLGALHHLWLLEPFRFFLYIGPWGERFDDLSLEVEFIISARLAGQ